MLIGAMIFMRVLISQIIISPKSTQNTKMAVSETNKSNVFVFASLLYHILMGNWRMLSQNSSNQEHLMESEATKAGQPLFVGTIS